MTGRIFNAGWQYSGTFLLGTALTLAALCSWSVPTLAAPESTVTPGRSGTIVATIGTLKQSARRWIEVDLSKQRLIAWEGSKQAFSTVVSTGKAATPTLTGVFAIQAKHVSTRMTTPDYNVPFVPYTMYYSGGYAIHGAYWHNRFGTPVSHGCVNLAVDQAERLFNWSSIGTPVVVHR